MTKVRLPYAFMVDRRERDLPVGKMTKHGSYVDVEVSQEVLEDIISDASFYASPDGPDMAPKAVTRSAKHAVRLLQDQGFM